MRFSIWYTSHMESYSGLAICIFVILALIVILKYNNLSRTDEKGVMSGGAIGLSIALYALTAYMLKNPTPQEFNQAIVTGVAATVCLYIFFVLNTVNPQK